MPWIEQDQWSSIIRTVGWGLYGTGEPSRLASQLIKWSTRAMFAGFTGFDLFTLSIYISLYISNMYIYIYYIYIIYIYYIYIIYYISILISILYGSTQIRWYYLWCNIGVMLSRRPQIVFSGWSPPGSSHEATPPLEKGRRPACRRGAALRFEREWTEKYCNKEHGNAVNPKP